MLWSWKQNPDSPDDQYQRMGGVYGDVLMLSWGAFRQPAHANKCRPSTQDTWWTSVGAIHPEHAAYSGQLSEVIHFTLSVPQPPNARGYSWYRWSTIRGASLPVKVAHHRLGATGGHRTGRVSGDRFRLPGCRWYGPFWSERADDLTAARVPVCISVGKAGCESAPGKQVLCPLVSCYMLERVCHRWGLGCQEGVPIWLSLELCVPAGVGSTKNHMLIDTLLYSSLVEYVLFYSSLVCAAPLHSSV